MMGATALIKYEQCIPKFKTDVEPSQYLDEQHLSAEPSRWLGEQASHLAGY